MQVGRNAGVRLTSDVARLHKFHSLQAPRSKSKAGESGARLASARAAQRLGSRRRGRRKTHGRAGGWAGGRAGGRTGGRKGSWGWAGRAGRRREARAPAPPHSPRRLRKWTYFLCPPSLCGGSGSCGTADVCAESRHVTRVTPGSPEDQGVGLERLISAKADIGCYTLQYTIHAIYNIHCNIQYMILHVIHRLQHIIHKYNDWVGEWGGGGREGGASP